MIEIKNATDFNKKLKEVLDDKFIYERIVKHSFRGSGIKKLTRINKKNFIGLNFSNLHFACLNFDNCLFTDCDFQNCTFENCDLNRCKFLNSKFYLTNLFETHLNDCVVKECRINSSIFGDCLFNNCEFLFCPELGDINWGGAKIINTIVKESNINYCQFGGDINETFPELKFENSLLMRNNFFFCDLKSTIFNETSLSLNTFTNCRLYNESFVFDEFPKDSEINSLDFTSINSSPELNLKVLKSFFGITSPEVKDYIREMTCDVQFQSVFISYSFKDSEFANFLNDELRKKGIITFLWEEDAIGGKKLSDIMSSGIQQKDRVLFIASEHSIKSKACQFELSEGRKKQDLIWKEVLFPIHIDNYLFKVEKTSIPKDNREEYWQNIECLKEVHSLSFVDFATGKGNQGFEIQLGKLIRGLKK